MNSLRDAINRENSIALQRYTEEIIHTEKEEGKVAKKNALKLRSV